ncbi:MAG: hypothetical protein J6U54_03520 [Clostridiales bacterium]|nr:hypothetical protein [Clostridiales bacterium]
MSTKNTRHEWPFNLLADVNALYPLDMCELPTCEKDAPKDLMASISYIFRHFITECGTKKTTLGANFILAIYRDNMTVPDIAAAYSVSRQLVYAYKNNVLSVLGRCPLYRNMLHYGLREYVEESWKVRWNAGYDRGYTDGLRVGRTERYHEEMVIKKIREDSTIEDCDFSIRTYNCLKRAGYEYVNQIIDLEKTDLLSIRNMGNKSADEVVCLMNAIKESRRNAIIDEIMKRGATKDEIDTVTAIINKYKEV